jgi:hypothetical protein
MERTPEEELIAEKLKPGELALIAIQLCGPYSESWNAYKERFVQVLPMAIELCQMAEQAIAERYRKEEPVRKQRSKQYWTEIEKRRQEAKRET